MFINYRDAFDWCLKAFGLHEIKAEMFTDEDGRLCIRTNLMVVPRRQASAVQREKSDGVGLLRQGTEEGPRCLAEHDRDWKPSYPRAEEQPEWK